MEVKSAYPEKEANSVELALLASSTYFPSVTS
jgi:hypothetical protein